MAKGTGFAQTPIDKVATRTNALWQRVPAVGTLRIRPVATRTNALWQRSLHAWTLTRTAASQPARMRCGKDRVTAWRGLSYAVATRTNALWQSAFRCKLPKGANVATRTNALWQRRLRKRQTRCELVATRTNALWQRWVAIQIFSVVTSQPARMRCGKVMRLAKRLQPTGRNPRECAVAKSRHCCARTENSENMNYVLHF